MRRQLSRDSQRGKTKCGRHVLTLALDPKLGALQHAIGTLVVSNDHSFRPAGFSPQANWAKRWWQ